MECGDIRACCSFNCSGVLRAIGVPCCGQHGAGQERADVHRLSRAPYRPALAVEITLSTLILGPLVTTLSLAGYVSDPQFAIYFTNVLGWIHYHLPGVFLGNPLGGIVNGQLWTVPSELHCYILLAVLMVLRIATRPVLMLAVFVVLASAESATALLPGHHYDVRVLNSQEMLVLCFLCGNVFFLWREKIQANVWLFLASVLTFVGVFYLAPSLSFLVGVIAATYFITYLGMQRIPRVPVLMDGDYSYGVYLYSFALQQAVVWALPNQRVLVGQLRDRGAACADCCGVLVACGRKAEPLVA